MDSARLSLPNGNSGIFFLVEMMLSSVGGKEKTDVERQEQLFELKREGNSEIIPFQAFEDEVV